MWKNKWHIFTKTLGISCLCLTLISCTDQRVSGPVQVRIIQPTERHCEYTIASGRIETLYNLSRLEGAIGKVVTSNENVDSRREILNEQESFIPVDIQFTSSGNVYSALDYDSLFAVSLYHAIETGHSLFSRLDPSANMVEIVPQFAQKTLIVHEARRTFGELGVDPEVKDNAEYSSVRVIQDGVETVFNYFFSFPTLSITELPLGLNLGIMVHEYSHLVMQHLFYEPGFKNETKVSSNKPTMNTLSALDEGIADYFGFLATGDPAYFLCTYPQEKRNLSVAKGFGDPIAPEAPEYTHIVNIASDRDFDPHLGGAVFAAINYEIGKALGTGGFEINGKYLIKLIPYLLTCPEAQLSSSSTNTLNINFGTVAACHVKLADGQHQSIIRSIYNSRLAEYGGI